MRIETITREIIEIGDFVVVNLGPENGFVLRLGQVVSLDEIGKTRTRVTVLSTHVIDEDDGSLSEAAKQRCYYFDAVDLSFMHESIEGAPNGHWTVL